MWLARIWDVQNHKLPSQEQKDLVVRVPHQVTPSINLRLSFDRKKHVAIGGVVLPEQTLLPPRVTFELPKYALEEERTSQQDTLMLMMWDMDANYCLWLTRIGDDGKTMDILPYRPVHPSRGTGYHRIIMALLRNVKISDDSIGWDKLSSAEQIAFRRSIPDEIIRQSIPKTAESVDADKKILGFILFRTCWTRSVDEVIFGTDAAQQLGRGDLVDEPKAEVVNLTRFGASRKSMKLVQRQTQQWQ